jgi:hypothetical protein
MPNLFKLIENYLGFAGPYMKSLIIEIKIDQTMTQKLLNLFPNLRSLKLLHFEASNKTLKMDLKSTKLESLQLRGSAIIESLFESLEKCAIKELEYVIDEDSSGVLPKLLKVQEKNLKRLAVIGDCLKSISFDLNLLVGLKDLRLEHFGFTDRNCPNIPLEFLKQQVDLTSTRLYTRTFSKEFFDTIFELKDLEDVELISDVEVRHSGLNNIYKLQKLRRLSVNVEVSRNIVENLQFGVFKNLEELDATFDGASVELIQKMKQFTPNLKKIIIRSDSSDTVDALLDNLENLESMRVVWGPIWNESEKVYPKIKHLEVPRRAGFFAVRIPEMFPNLVEFIKNLY